MEYFKPRELLDSPLPTLRAAYSDRTSWLMASLAKLAYLEFEASPQKLDRLESELKVAGFELIKTFNEEVHRHSLLVVIVTRWRCWSFVVQKQPSLKI